MMKGIFIAFFVVGVVWANAQCNCRENFDFIYQKTKVNYAGWKDKVNATTKHPFELLTDSLRTLTQQIKTDSACVMALNNWLKFFNDRHTTVYQPMIHYESKGSQKPLRFSLEKVNSRTFLLTLPSFDSRYKKNIDSLIRANHDELIQTPNLIIDVRNNGGGDDITYSDVIPYLYTNPIKAINNSILSSPDNIQKFEAIATNPSYPEANRRYARFLVKKLKANPGEFYRKDDNTIRLKSVMPNPVNVIVLINKGCTSSCEEFLLTARQSNKVLLMGETSGGVLDYANVHYLKLPCKAWLFQYATSRTNRLPEFPIDNIGLAPEVKIPEGKNWIEFAVEYLKSK